MQAIVLRVSSSRTTSHLKATMDRPTPLWPRGSAWTALDCFATYAFASRRRALAPSSRPLKCSLLGLPTCLFATRHLRFSSHTGLQRSFEFIHLRVCLLSFSATLPVPRQLTCLSTTTNSILSLAAPPFRHNAWTPSSGIPRDAEPVHSLALRALRYVSGLSQISVH